MDNPIAPRALRPGRTATSPRRAGRGIAGALVAGALVAGALVGGAAGPAGAADDDATGTKPPLVVVAGEATVRTSPDRAFVVVAVEARDKDPKQAQRRNAEVMTAVQAKLRGAGVAAEAVRTLGFQLDLESDWVNGRRIPRGYVARNTVEVRLDEIARVGEIIDLSIGAGATDVASVRFDLRDRAAAGREALRQAVADARARADAAAAGAGLAIAGVQRIEEVGGPEPPVPMMRSMAPAMADAAPPAPETPIAAGEIEVRSVVRLFALLR